MTFEVLNALRDLDRRTPAFFLEEIFHHGDQTMRERALEILKDLDPQQHRSSAVLRDMLKVA